MHVFDKTDTRKREPLNPSLCSPVSKPYVKALQKCIQATGEPDGLSEHSVSQMNLVLTTPEEDLVPVSVSADKANQICV